MEESQLGLYLCEVAALSFVGSVSDHCCPIELQSRAVSASQRLVEQQPVSEDEDDDNPCEAHGVIPAPRWAFGTRGTTRGLPLPREVRAVMALTRTCGSERGGIRATGFPTATLEDKRAAGYRYRAEAEGLGVLDRFLRETCRQPTR